MILLVHSCAQKLIAVEKNGEKLAFSYKNCIDGFWGLASKYPEEIIVWCEESLRKDLNFQAFSNIFHHDLIMASYAVHHFFSGDLGYVDTLPFINVKRDVQYPTWQMSTDVGGIKAKVLLQFRNLLKNIQDFEYLLNSIGKIGQQNSLLCYSSPKLLKMGKKHILLTGNEKLQIFQFVYQHYNTSWVFVLLFCYIFFERTFPFLAFIQSFFHKKYFRRSVDLSQFLKRSKSSNIVSKKTIDVIIPTIGRPEHLRNLVKDLAAQSFKPEKVIVVEQDPESGSVSQLPFLLDRHWPFTIIHHFIHQTGACNARNIALAECSSDFIFFADDDIRVGPDLLAETVRELIFFKVGAINMNCKQVGEETVFGKVKQWGSFGSGTSMVTTFFAQKCHFSPVFEHGYGEDADFGYQLRRAGCDILYHPKLEILHLKASVGGLRQKVLKAWELEPETIKPSPTIMALAQRNYTRKQIRGYKVSLYLKFYQNQSVKNPYKYFRSMQLRWRKSEIWAMKLQELQ